MTIKAAKKFVGLFCLVLQESKIQFRCLILLKLSKISILNLFVRFFTSGKRTKELTGEYFYKIGESIGIINAASILV